MLSRKVILRALACALLAMVPFPDQENQLYDLKVRLLSRTQFQPPSNVVIVELTQEDFAVLRKRFDSDAPLEEGGLGPWREKFEALRTQFFWDDKVYEGLLRKLLSELPRRLLVTFFYNESLVLLRNDSELRRLARRPEVLWASQFDPEGGLLKPAPELTGTENYGFTNLQPDRDGVIRRAFLVRRNHISLPFRALLDAQEPLRRSPSSLSEPLLIRYSGPPGFIPTCGIADLMNAAPESSRCGSLKGKYVILSPSGNIVAGTSLYRTPVGYMSRGEVLANILLTAKNGGAYRPVGGVFLFALVFLHCLLVAWVVLYSGSRRFLLLFGLMGGEALLALALMRASDLQVPSLPFLLSTAAAFIAFQAMRFAQQESKRWQAEKKAQYLRELDELKSNFLSLMSHDLKTPIAKVQALAERLHREARGLTDEQKQILDAIQRSNEELSQYILSILNFQRIESQELKLNRKNHDVNLMIEDVIGRLLPLAQDRAVKVELDLEPMFPVEFDEQLIRQVLNNIVDNAIKYNKPGTQVIVSSRDLGDFVEVSVQDDGSGIDPAQMPLLFKKFSRAEKGTSERVKGTGLGLYLARYFIELHGGEISVASEPGKGTCFRFRLPVSA